MRPTDPRSPLTPLRRAVRDSGQTQVELCDLLGITQKHMSQFMTGKAAISEQLAADLCRALHVFPVILTEGEFAERIERLTS